MTPQQISDYKRKWMASGDNYPVRLHSDLRSQAKDWCKKLDKQEWSHSTFTNVYEDTFYFENQMVSQQFEEEFLRWVTND